jgi:hypothetical protein
MKIPVRVYVPLLEFNRSAPRATLVTWELEVMTLILACIIILASQRNRPGAE